MRPKPIMPRDLPLQAQRRFYARGIVPGAGFNRGDHLPQPPRVIEQQRYGMGRYFVDGVIGYVGHPYAAVAGGWDVNGIKPGADASDNLASLAATVSGRRRLPVSSPSSASALELAGCARFAAFQVSRKYSRRADRFDQATVSASSCVSGKDVCAITTVDILSLPYTLLPRQS